MYRHSRFRIIGNVNTTDHYGIAARSLATIAAYADANVQFELQLVDSLSRALSGLLFQST